MATILQPGYLRWDGSKFVLDPTVEIVGPPGPPGPGSSIITLTGDVIGSGTAGVVPTTVVSIQGNAIASGPLVDGYFLVATSSDTLGFVGISGDISASASGIINLGNGTLFGVLASSTVTNTGSTTVSGNIGVSPGSAITGFPPGSLTGTKHTADVAAASAQSAALVAYTAGKALPGTTIVAGTYANGAMIAPGVYTASSSLNLTGGIVTLDGYGNPDASWIFQIGSTLVTASSTVIQLTGGASAQNVFWLVGSSATLGTDTTFVGNIIAYASITDNGGSNVTGSLIALNAAVNLNDTTVTFSQQNVTPGKITVLAINGTTVPSGPSVNDVLVANSSSSALWQLLTDSQISATAAIQGTKISPNFGSQNISTTGSITGSSYQWNTTPNFGAPASVVFPSDANYVVPSGQYKSFMLLVTSSGSLSATRNLILPLTAGSAWMVQNNTTGVESIIAIGSSGTGVTILTGAGSMVWTDGINFYKA